jgi:Peptidase family M49
MADSNTTLQLVTISLERIEYLAINVEKELGYFHVEVSSIVSEKNVLHIRCSVPLTLTILVLFCHRYEFSLERNIMTKASSNPSHVQVEIKADTSHLSDVDFEVLNLLVEAAKLIDVIYLRQSQQEHLTGGFDPSVPKAFYPEGMTVEQIEAYLDTNPDERDAVLNPFTVVFGSDEDLEPIPYSEVYASEMVRIAELLARAADLSTDRHFKEFLRLRSEAFLTNRYRESDIAWIHANHGPFEFTVGPYESYADKLFGVKRTFESILGVVLQEDTKLASSYQGMIQRFDASLGERYGYVAKTTLTPMVVMDQVFAGGEAIYEYVPMAYNLPNDRDIHAEVGSKKVFVKNVMFAKFDLITARIARMVLRFEDVERFCDLQTYLKFVIGHESAHGLSFHFGGDTFGPVASAIEEGKADVFGMWFLYYLVEHGVIDAQTAQTAVMQNLTDGLRQIRFGLKKAHAVGTVIQINWFVEAGALQLSEAGLDFDASRFKVAIESLGDELYELAASKDKVAVEAFVDEWGRWIPEKILQLLPRFADVPVDIDPIFSV